MSVISFLTLQFCWNDFCFIDTLHRIIGIFHRYLFNPTGKHSLDKSTQLPIKRQCELLNIARSTAYYQPTGLSTEEIELRHMIDEIHLQYPFMGSRRIRTELAKNERHVNRKRIVRIMLEIGIGAG